MVFIHKDYLARLWSVRAGLTVHPLKQLSKCGERRDEASATYPLPIVGRGTGFKRADRIYDRPFLLDAI